MRMFDKRLAQHGEYMAQNAILSGNATQPFATEPLRLSGAGGGTALTVKCRGQVTIPAGGMMHLVIKDSDDKAGTYKEVCRVTFHEGKYANAGHMGEAVLPSQTKKFVKGEVVTVGACHGAIDIYPYATR